jgi:hypothetical protein
MTARDRTHGQRGRIASQVIDALIAGREIRPEDVYRAAGMTRSTFYNRMAKGDWKFDELVDIAAFLDEPITSFIDGLGGRFTGIAAAGRTGRNGPGGGGLPSGDSAGDNLRYSESTRRHRRLNRSLSVPIQSPLIAQVA